MVRRIFQALRLDKIAAVDRPCQEPALMTIMKRRTDGELYIAKAAGAADLAPAVELYLKRAFTDDKRKELAASGAALPDGSFPIENGEDLENAVHAIGRAKNPAKAKAHIKTRARALGMKDKIPDDWKITKMVKSIREEAKKGASVLAWPSDDDDEGAEGFDQLIDQQALSEQLWQGFYKATDALRQSICSILKDEAVADKSAMIEESLEEFADYVQGIIPGDVGKALATGFVTTIAGSAGSTLNTGVPMSDALKKALGLPATATEADMLKALEAKSSLVAKMSDKHSAFMNHKDAKLPKGGKDAFQEMSPADRDEHIEKNPIEEGEDAEKMAKALAAGDAFKTPEGQVMFKRDFGTDAGFNFAKGQNEKSITMAADLAKRNETDLVTTFAKRAVDIGQPEAFGAVMRKAYSGDAAAQGELEKFVAGLQKQVSEGQLFSTFGSKTAKAGSAEAEMEEKKKEAKKAEPKLTDAQAFTKVYTDPANASLKKRYDEERRAA